MSKRDEAIKRIDLKGKGLELGPLFSPLISKEEANITYVDHMSTEGLMKKYKDHATKKNSAGENYIEEIVPVDYALEGKTLKATLKGKKYDYVVASHVIEHIPDIVGWLADVNSILKDGGILSLVIPDKRFTFDILRNESRPADVVGAYLDKQTRASSVTMYDYMTNLRRDIVAADVWNGSLEDFDKKGRMSIDRAYELCLENLKPDKYVDSHCFVFTPYSFFKVLRALIEHNLFGYEIAYFQDTPKYQLEFYVSLRKVKSPADKKIRSLPKIPKPPERWELEAELQDLRNQLQALTNSTSWRVTKTARRISNYVKKRKKKLN